LRYETARVQITIEPASGYCHLHGSRDKSVIFM
jgi:hypothetical protein